MIHDIIIIKEGVPILSKNLTKSHKSVFSKEDQLVLISGFFSALNSFSDQFKELGSISELKLSNNKNNDLKLSFLRDDNIENMIYLAAYNDESKSVNVKHFLKKISNSFLNRYGLERIVNWNGKREIFESFEGAIEQFAQEENKEREEISTLEIFKEMDDYDQKKMSNDKPSEINSSPNHGKDAQSSNLRSNYDELVPIPKGKKKINAIHYLSGENALKIYEKIDGKINLSQISCTTNMPVEQIYRICKSLIKFGFIDMPGC